MSNCSGRDKGATKQGVIQGRADTLALLPGGGNITSQHTKRLRSGPRSKGSRDLLLDFEYAQISFGLIVIKANATI